MWPRWRRAFLSPRALGAAVFDGLLSSSGEPGDTLPIVFFFSTSALLHATRDLLLEVAGAWLLWLEPLLSPVLLELKNQKQELNLEQPWRVLRV